jgi:hypothetical protein
MLGGNATALAPLRLSRANSKDAVTGISGNGGNQLASNGQFQGAPRLRRALSDITNTTPTSLNNHSKQPATSTSGNATFHIYEDPPEPSQAHVLPTQSMGLCDVVMPPTEAEVPLPPVQGFGASSAVHDQDRLDPDGFGSPAELAAALSQNVDSCMIMGGNQNAADVPWDLSNDFSTMDCYSSSQPGLAASSLSTNSMCRAPHNLHSIDLFAPLPPCAEFPADVDIEFECDDMMCDV